MKRADSYQRIAKPNYDSKGKAIANPFDSLNFSNQKAVNGGYTSSNYMEDRPPSKQGDYPIVSEDSARQLINLNYINNNFDRMPGSQN